MAAPILGKCAVPLMLFFFCFFVCTGFKIRDGCGGIGKCRPEERPIAVTPRKLETVRGKLARLHRPQVIDEVDKRNEKTREPKGEYVSPKPGSVSESPEVEQVNESNEDVVVTEDDEAVEAKNEGGNPEDLSSPSSESKEEETEEDARDFEDESDECDEPEDDERSGESKEAVLDKESNSVENDEKSPEKDEKSPEKDEKSPENDEKSSEKDTSSSENEKSDEEEEKILEDDEKSVEVEKNLKVEEKVARDPKITPKITKLEKVRHANKDKTNLKEEESDQSPIHVVTEEEEPSFSYDSVERFDAPAPKPITTPQDTNLKPKPRNAATSETLKVAAKVIEYAAKPAKTTEKPEIHGPKRAYEGISLTQLNDEILRLPSFMLNFSEVEDTKCQQHGKIFLRQLRGHKLWALQMLDSGAKIPSGLLRGNINAFGDFDQCLDIMTRVKIKEHIVKIQGKYCLATLDLHAIQPGMKVPVNLMQSRSFIRGNMRDPGHFIPRFTTAHWGLCLPAACSALDAQRALEKALEPYNLTVGIRFSANVDPEMCYVKQKSEGYSKETIGVLYFYAMVICLVTVATTRDLFSKSDEKGNYAERIIMSFSLQRTLRALLKDNSSFTGDVTCIHGIRSLSTIALYVAHKLIPTSRMPYANRVLLTEVANNPISSVLRVSLVYTDSFLLLSGVLTAYNMAKELSTRGEIRWFCRFVTRYIRLTPSLLVIIFWYTFVMEHAGSGPQWNSVIKANADVCKKNAWTNLLYIQNFFPFEEMCATHTHQLALDMQLSLFVPALVFFLQIKPVIGVLLVFFLLQVSATLRYLATANNNLSLVIFHGMTLKHLYKTANLTYMLTLHRATPYLFGVLLGVFLNYTGKNVKIPKILVVFGWLVAAILGLWSLFYPWRAARRDFVYNVEDAAFYAVLAPVFSALALTWVIFACFTNHGGFINKILSSYWLTIFSRISYAVYLMQFAIFFYNVGTSRYTSEFRIHRALDPLELFAVIAVSLIVTLFFDIPMQEVKNVLLECSDGPFPKSEKPEPHKLKEDKDSDYSDPDNDGLRSTRKTDRNIYSDYELDHLRNRRQTLIGRTLETRNFHDEDEAADDDDDDVYARDRFLRLRRDRSSSRSRSSKEDAKFTRSNLRERPSSLESEEGAPWELVQRERSLSRDRISPKGRIRKLVDQRRLVSSGSDEEPFKEKSQDAGSIGDEEMDSLRRRSSAEGKLALLRDFGSMNLWTVTKVPHLGSSQEPSEPEDDSYLRVRERRERSPVPEEVEQKEEDKIPSYDFVLRRDSKRVTVSDLSNVQHYTNEGEEETESLRSSSGLFKRESIVKSQASEEDPEYLLPERPKLQEQEQEHPLKKAWQLQKSRSEEDGASGFAIKEAKSKIEEEQEEKKESGESSAEFNIIWQMKSVDIQEVQDAPRLEWSGEDDRSRLLSQTAEEVRDEWNVDET